MSVATTLRWCVVLLCMQCGPAAPRPAARSETVAPNCNAKARADGSQRCLEFGERWFYQAGRCLLAQTDGCGEDYPGFASQRECETACPVWTPEPGKEACFYRPGLHEQLCAAALPRWYYVAESAGCVQGTYDGCSSRVGFVTRDDCEFTCL